MSTTTPKHTRCQRRRARCVALVACLATALAMWGNVRCEAQQSFAQFWITGSANMQAGSTPPATMDALPQIPSTPGGTGALYLWGRPATGMTLENWSLDVVSSLSSIVSFTSGDVANYNHQLGTSGGVPLYRWEWDAPGRVDNNGTLLTGLKGFSVLGSTRRGIGVGPQAAMLNDPNYSAGANAWLLAKINFVSTAPAGIADISLRIASQGVNHTGQSAATDSVKLGASSNPPLSGSIREGASHTLVARVVLDANAGIAADFSGDGVVDGTDFLRWQRNVGVQTGATRAMGDANGDGAVGAADLAAWKAMFRTPTADFDGDGDADGADLLNWQRGVSVTVDSSLALGDANGDRSINGDDLALWRGAFAAAAPLDAAAASPVEAAIPEPATGCLAVLLLTCCPWLRGASIGYDARRRRAWRRSGRRHGSMVALALLGAMVATAPARVSHAQLFDYWPSTAKITAADTTFNHSYGNAVAIGGQYTVIGAEGKPTTGGAYLHLTPNLFENYPLAASDGVDFDGFGRAVGTSGQFSIIGAPQHANGAGAAYVYNNETRQELHKLTASDGAAGALFGLSVATSYTGLAVVGAPNGGAGGAYVYDIASGQELRKLNPSDVGAFGIGYSVAMSGNIALVGGANGAAYLFDASTGQQLHTLTANDINLSDHFGYTLAISGNYALVGASTADNGGSDRGSAYLFDVTTGAQLHKFTASDAANEDFFGSAVAISGSRAIIGAPNNDGAGANAGAAYVFDLVSGQQRAKITPPTTTDALFGSSIALAGGRVLIGAPSDDENGNYAGAVYEFQKTSLWYGSASGPWTAGPWFGGEVPNSASDYAEIVFASNPPGPITLDVDVTLNRLKFGSSTINNDITGPHALTLSADPETGTGPAIEATTGVNTISAPIRGDWGLTKMGAGTLVISGPKQYGGIARQINVDGSMEQYATGTRIEEGRLIVEGDALPTGLITLFQGSEIEFRNYSTYTLSAGTRLHGYHAAGFGAPITNVIMTNSSPTQLVVGAGARLTGSLRITADALVNHGRVAPGSSPGVIAVEGDYQQSATGVLEIEVGSLAGPGVGYDQLNVTGAATLGGRLEVPLIDLGGGNVPFVPANGDTVPFLTAGTRVGTFDTVVAPHLSPLRAVDVVYSPGGASLVFANAFNDVELQPFAGTRSWDDLGAWQNPGADRAPAFIDNLSITTGATAQTVELTSGTRRVNQLEVAGGAGALTIVVGDNALTSANLVATRGAEIMNNGVLAIKEGALLSTPELTISSGGLLQGRGTVAGDLVVGAAVGAAGVVSPGFSVGTLKVAGDYKQNAAGELKIEIDSETSFDKLQIAGEANLGGKLTLDPNGFTAGVPMEIVTADALGPGTFATVDVLGGGARLASLVYVEETSTSKGAVLAAIVDRGDMNFDGVPNAEDARELARFFQDADSWTSMWRSAGKFPNPSAANINGQGKTDFDDILEFGQRYGAGAMATFAAAYAEFSVPEPTSAGLLTTSLLAAAATRRRRSRAAGRQPERVRAT